MRWNGLGTAGAAVFAVLWVVAGCTDPTGSEDSSRSLRTGDRNAHNAGGAGFHMRFVADGLTCPAGLDDLGEATVDAAFWIGETEVTYELWYEVRTWAEGNWYIFQNAGVEGSHGASPGNPPTADRNHPVTNISWRDAMVWTNALTEYYNEQYNANLECVYTFGGSVIRGSHNANACDDAVAGEQARGFRLLTSAEWELAARYIGTTQPADEPLKSEAILKDGTWWTPGSYAAGATADYEDLPATWEAAWYTENSTSTNEVGQKPPDGTGLGLYDMSGNVLQWCFDWHPDEPGTQRVFRGGSWDYSAGHLQVGREASNTPAAMDVAFGFRLARTQ